MLYGLIGGEGILLTGNAGLGSLTNAAVYAEHLGIRVSEQLKFFQVPASGDANHLSPSILDRLIGAARPPSEKPPHLSAFLPPPSGRPELPHRAVVHALAERGAQIARTEGRIFFGRSSLTRASSHD